jgi:hypothetical protein
MIEKLVFFVDFHIQSFLNLNIVQLVVYVQVNVTNFSLNGKYLNTLIIFI